MSGTLNAAQAGRLLKICGMFGSEHDGERAAAALQAFRLLRECGVSWQDLLAREPASETPRPPSTGRRSPPNALRARILWAMTYRSLLSSWELDFLSNLSCRSSLTVGQLQKLDETIADIGKRVRHEP
jgi:hypothetical protein